jgi:outer membrane lipoprotein SlyB
MKRTSYFLAVLVALNGCAMAPPNTPGAGYGKDYTPVIDISGVDQNRYTGDLAECRQYSGIIDADKAAMQGMIGGIIVGALLGAAVGSNHGMSSYGANQGAILGGGAGIGQAANRARNQQERIMINCMAGRGYRTLDGSAQASTTYPSPYLQAGNAPAAQLMRPSYGVITPSNGAQQNVMLQPVSAPATQPVIYTSPQADAAQQTRPEIPKGNKDMYQAEKFATQNSCSTPVIPWVAGAGAGYETYSALCANGTSLIIRCEFGNCRALR